MILALVKYMKSHLDIDKVQLFYYNKVIFCVEAQMLLALVKCI